MFKRVEHGRNSRDAEGVENSNSVQKSGAEDDIVNAAGRNSRDAEGLKTVIQFKRVELKMTLRMLKLHWEYRR